MSTRNTRIRFAQNNFAELTTASIAYSSALAAFPSTNATNKFRSRVWKPSGRFTIDTTNDKVYINDGGDVTVTLTSGEYTTPDLLATEVQTQLNASSANWTVAYNVVAGDFSFKISNSGSVTLRLATTTNAAWDTLGYTTSSDITGTAFIADQQRNHTSETATFDMGYNAEIKFFAMIAPLDELFGISATATVTLLGSNLNQWTAPPLSITITPTSKGILDFIDDLDDTAYRFWRINIIDRLHPDGPSALSVGHIFLGDYVTSTTRNASAGFDTQDVDPSRVAVSESGVLHFDTRTKYGVIENTAFAFLPKADKDTMRTMYEVLGSTTPFYISLDPTTCITDTLEELTKYVVFNRAPVFSHVFSNTFSMSLSFREAI